MKKAYSNNGLSWRLVEEGHSAQTGEVLFDHDATEAELTAAFSGYANAVSKAKIIEKIAALEALQTPRLVREAQTAATNVFPATDANFAGLTSAQALASIQTQIAALRAQIV